jgi:hypothetical protein
MTTVKLEHLRKLRYCSNGVRKFFAKYNLDYNNFLKHGIDAKELEKTNDGMALEAIKEAQK